ncbi:cation:proton antiporter [Pseudonocardia kujensis]|uniref:cation:proton antiporter n=1 Tax=Pseudonocardia kujensis TaxID=1128675 RepID=UPI001E376B49|nr:cation:proton antiporter [Pseudonocardia kujensis]MCE0766016.1 cation:proton antiporter [Pseudonocardia kujensis]
MISLTSVALVGVLALLSPLLVRLVRLPVPDVVVQIVLGVLVGPGVLGLARVDEPVRVLSVVGLSFLLFLAGLEIDIARLRGRVARIAASAFVVSFALALAVGTLLGVVGIVGSPVLIAVILSATAAGVVLPVLQDSGDAAAPLGGLVIAGAAIAEVVPVVLLSLLFAGDGGSLGSRVALLAAFAALSCAVAVVVLRLAHLGWLTRALAALQDTTAEIRVRGAVALLVGFAALAAGFGLEAILGSFLAGAAISVLDPDRAHTHPQFRPKVQAVGFGALIPFFFVSTGMSLDVESFTQPATLVRIPVFLAAILLVRGLPALLYRRLLNGRREIARAALLQATTLTIPVVGGAIGVDLRLITPDNEVALVAAAVVSVIAFPILATTLARRRSESGPRDGRAAV